MAQQLLDLVQRFGGADAVAAMASRVGLSPEQAQSAMAALMPAVAGGMVKQVEAQGPASLDAVAAPAAELADPASDAAVAHGDGLVNHLFGSSEVTSAITSQAAATTGLDMSKLAALLPMVASLAAGALGKAGGQATAAPAADGGIGGMLGGLLGSITGGAAPAGAATGGVAGTLMGMLDFNKDGNPMDDVMGMLGKMRGR